MFKKYLLENSLLTENEIKEIEERVIREIKDAVEFAKESPYPDPQEAFDDLYV
jgi:pyruvate dehydrogenase E1 component alpha subunit